MPPEATPTPQSLPIRTNALYPPELGRIVGSIAGTLAADHARGQAAELRRYEGDLSGAFFDLYFTHALDRWRFGGNTDESEHRWGVGLQLLAIGSGLHSYDAPLGRALAHGGVSELRFGRLCRSSGDALHLELRRAAHRLSVSNTPANHAEMVWLIMRDGEHDVTRSRERRALARSYFSTLYTASQKAD